MTTDPIPSSQNHDKDKYDTFAEQAVEADTKSRETEAHLNELDQLIDRKLIEYDVQNVIFADGSENAVVTTSVITAYNEYLHNQGVVDSELREELLLQFLKETQMKQLALYAEIRTLMIVHEAKAAMAAIGAYDKIDLQQTTNDKKFTLIARYCVMEGWSMESPWVKFLNDTVPGDIFDAAKASDYIIAAYEDYANDEAHREAFLTNMDNALEKAGLDPNNANHLDVFIKLHLIVGARMRTAQGELTANEQAAIDEVAREARVDTGSARRLFQYIVELTINPEESS